MLLRLPDEILLEIIEWLINITDSENRAPSRYEESICGISYVCRRLNCLVTPILYRDYDKWGIYGEQFLRTLATRPDLAALVKRFSWVPDGHLHTLHDVNDRVLVAERFCEIGTPSAVKFAENFRTLPYLDDGNCDFENVGYGDDQFVEAVLMLTPNIKTLEVWDRYQATVQAWPWTDSMALGLPHTFSQLQSVLFSVSCMRWEDLQPLVLLPSLKSLTLRQLGALDDEPFTIWGNFCSSNMPPATSSIEHLSLYHSFVPSKVLAAIIGIPRALKSFEYEHTPMSHEEDWDHTMDYALLTSALSSHRYSLETLKLLHDFTDTGASSLLGSLVELECLKVVHVPMSALLAQNTAEASQTSLINVLDILPPGLCDLELSAQLGTCELVQDLAPLLEVVAEHATTRFPALQKISVGKLVCYRDDQPDFKTVNELCAGRLIRFCGPKKSAIRYESRIGEENRFYEFEAGDLGWVG